MFSSQLIGVFRVMLRSKAKTDERSGYFGDDGAVTVITRTRGLGGVMQGANRLTFGATGVLIGILIGSAITYLWFFQDINHNFSRKSVVEKIKSSLLKSDAAFMHATSRELKLYPIYLPDGNCAVVRPVKSILYESEEIIFCFDKNWGGPAQRIVDVTMHLKSDVPEKVAQ